MKITRPILAINENVMNVAKAATLDDESFFLFFISLFELIFFERSIRVFFKIFMSSSLISRVSISLC